MKIWRCDKCGVESEKAMAEQYLSECEEPIHLCTRHSEEFKTVSTEAQRVFDSSLVNWVQSI